MSEEYVASGRRVGAATIHPRPYLSAFCTSRPAVTPIVVGSEAAHTPSRLSVRSSISEATTSGGAHSKHAVRPGEMNWICPDTLKGEDGAARVLSGACVRGER